MNAARIGLRGRLVVATSWLSLATLGAAFAVVSFAVNRSQQRQLDDALVPAAREEAAEVVRADLASGEPPIISDRPGPAANDVGPLPKFVAVYRPDGRLASATVNFVDAAPALDAIRKPDGECFDLQVAGRDLRAVLVSIPQAPGATLLMAVSRADLDGDANFLARAMMTVFALAVAWTAAIAWWIAGRLTRAHRAIVETTQRVTSGDLAARVASHGAAADPDGLGRNVDEMIERLALLLRGQQQFIAQAAHELRSPLTMLHGELSFAIRRERGAADYRKTIEEALDASRRLKVLAEDLLSLARLGTEPSPLADDVPLADVVSTAVAGVSQEAAKRRVRLEIVGSGGSMAGRASDLERMFRNLLENAVRHAPSGSAVIVETHEKRDEWTVEVTDQGAGVAPQDRPHIFDPFYRGRAVRAGVQVGAGLGLTIARDIARLHGGDIELGDSHTSGARFVVRLPVKRVEQAAESPRSRRS